MKTSIILLLSFALVSCQTAPAPSAPVPARTFYALNLQVQVNSQTIVGWGVAPLAKQYQVTVTPTDQIDRIQWRTCNQDHFVDKPNGGSWFNVFRGDSYTFTLTPDPQLDQQHDCPLEIDVMAQRVNKFQSAIVEFGDARPEYVLLATMSCNGIKYSYRGVLICSSAEGLIQQVTFDRPVVAAQSDPLCSDMKDVDGKKTTYQFPISAGDCLYTFGAEAKAPNGQHLALRLLTHGYNSIPTEQ